MKTRKDYTDGKVTHREYYGQFVDTQTFVALDNNITEERIIASKDEHFNDIPLDEWDNLPVLPIHIRQRINRLGETYSLATTVCIYKEAARQIREEEAQSG